MPTIFYKCDGRWEAEKISSPLGLLSLAPVKFDSSSDWRDDSAGVCLLARTGPDEVWVCIVRGGYRLLYNGQTVTAGLRVLAHKDSLAVEGHEAVFFSTEEVARIEPYAGAAKASCPRCRSELLPGQPAVKCPRCGVWHHETEDRNCWGYGQTCALCAQPTGLDAGLQWTPETL